MPAELPYKNEHHPVHQELPPGGEAVKYEMYQDNTAKYEMPAAQEQPPAELPNNVVERDAR
jgi:hypothetical protein